MDWIFQAQDRGNWTLSFECGNDPSGSKRCWVGRKGYISLVGIDVFLDGKWGLKNQSKGVLCSTRIFLELNNQFLLRDYSILFEIIELEFLIEIILLIFVFTKLIICSCIFPTDD
jgi:hypothetical protein